MFTIMGITGNVGGAIAENLLASGKAVRGVVRNPEKAKRWVERGIEHVQAEWSMPDVIISDLQMPHMNGFEFLSVVRRRFPSIPVIVISGEFTGFTVPESVLADAFFPKGGYRPEDLFNRIEQFLIELPTRPRVGKPPKSAIWVKTSGDMVAVTCTDCLRTFPVADAAKGVNQVPCDFCPALIRVELIEGRSEAIASATTADEAPS